jgi:hypothetical protein
LPIQTFRRFYVDVCAHISYGNRRRLELLIRTFGRFYVDVCALISYGNT